MRFVLVAALVLLAVLAGCSEGGVKEVRLSPPENPGRLEDLEGTVWEAKGYNTVTIGPNGSASIQAGQNTTDPGKQTPAIEGSYTYTNGVLEFSFPGMPPIYGTWDGETLRVQDPEFKIHKYEKVGAL